MLVRCRICGWSGEEEKLVAIYTLNPQEPGDVIPVPGCPACLTDTALESENEHEKEMDE